MPEGGIAVEAPSTSSTTAELSPTPAAPSVKVINSDNTIQNLESKVVSMQQTKAAKPKNGLEANPEVDAKITEEKATPESVKTEGKPSAEEPSIIPETEAQQEKDLQNDPLYQKSLGEVTGNAISKGEPLDGKKLQEEALARYKQEKAKESTENKTEEQTVDKKLDEAAKRIGTLLENNKENLESTMVTVSAADLAILLKLVAETKEPNPKKKETKLMLVLKLLGILVLSGVMETGKVVVPPTSQS